MQLMNIWLARHPIWHGSPYDLSSNVTLSSHLPSTYIRNVSRIMYELWWQDIYAINPICINWCLSNTHKVHVITCINSTSLQCTIVFVSCATFLRHYNDVIMSATASKITSLTIVYSTVYSGADQRKHQSSASLAFVGGIHRPPVNPPHKRPVTW